MNIISRSYFSLASKVFTIISLAVLVNTWTFCYAEGIETSYKDVSITNGEVEFKDATVDATVIVDQIELSSGYYVVNSDVTINERIVVTGDVHIILSDDSTLTAIKGICVTESSNTLTIYGQEKGTGSIVVSEDVEYYNAAIGGSDSEAGAITINGGTIEVLGGYYGAGIGGGNGDGTVIINGGTIKATGGQYGAGIGSGSDGAGTVTINGGTIEAYGDYNSAGIGSGDGGNSTVTINNGTIMAFGGEYGAGIGCGEEGTGTVIINKGTIEAYGGYNGAAIGGGSRGDGVVTINGGSIKGIGGPYGSGIGGGEDGDGTVTINKGIIEARGGHYGTGIGGSDDGTGIIIIKNGYIEATGGEDGPGIGGGSYGEVTINGGTVKAQGGKDGAGIGGGDDGDATVTITAGYIEARGGEYGAGIGGGYSGDATVTISGGIIKARGGEDGAGIGGGEYADGTVIISAESVDARGGEYGAGIGGGCYGDGNVTINKGHIYVKGGENAAGIGGGNEGDGSITINGGVIDAIGGYRGDAIGSGDDGSYDATIKEGMLYETVGNRGKVGVSGSEQIELDNFRYVKIKDKGIVISDNIMDTKSDKLSSAKVNLDEYTSYQWYVNSKESTIGGTLVEGATNSDYILPSLEKGTYYYYVVCSDSTNEETSNIVAVIVEDIEETLYKDVSLIDGNLEFTDKTIDATIITTQTILTDGYYVVNDHVIIEDRITVLGDTKLILLDDARLKAGKGIEVNPKGSLTIYGGEGSTGELIVPDNMYSGHAGIGGSNGDSGDITINGGTIKSHGGYCGAGIGGGYDGDATIIINRGTIEAYGGDDGAGIGSGGVNSSNDDGGIGNITINGGRIKAVGGADASGIGYGYEGIGNVTINGGNAEVTDGENCIEIGSAEDGELNVTFGSKVLYEVSNLEMPLQTTKIGNGEVITNLYKFKYMRFKDEGIVIEGNRKIALEDDDLGDLVAIKIGLDEYLDYKWYLASSESFASGNIVEGEINLEYTLPDLRKGTYFLYITCSNGEKVETSNMAKITVEEVIETNYKDAKVEDGAVIFSDKTEKAVPILDQIELANEYYVVNKDVTIDERIIVNGNVNIILLDNCTLTAVKGIGVTGADNALTIFGCEDGTGKIIVPEGIEKDDAAIGGTDGSNGLITINGGTIEAVGSKYGSCIGGGKDGTGNLIINGGTIDAKGGSDAAAIGGGFFGGANITINGGNVKASGGESAAGIGSGNSGDANITINGGNIESISAKYGSAIGGGNGGAGNVTINDGIIKAECKGYGSGIGGGSYDIGTVFINGGDISAKCYSSNATAIGTGIYREGKVTLATTVLYSTSNSFMPSKGTKPGTGVENGDITSKYKNIKINTKEE